MEKAEQSREGRLADSFLCLEDSVHDLFYMGRLAYDLIEETLSSFRNGERISDDQYQRTIWVASKLQIMTAEHRDNWLARHEAAKG